MTLTIATSLSLSALLSSGEFFNTVLLLWNLSGKISAGVSSSPGFVGFVNPTYAAISDGLSNKYGYPHQETLDTLNQFGVKIFRTDQMDTIAMKTDGVNLMMPE